jgi:hypothetical protein
MEENVTPIPVGTVVTYHGSLSCDPDKRYVITAHCNPQEMFPEDFWAKYAQELSDAYPDGVAYTIWPEGMPQEFGLREYMVYRVRRGSLKEEI